MFTRELIVAEIKRTARENAGTPLGVARFRAETGIKASDWIGRFWARWSDALREAGFEPNVLRGARDEDEMLGKLVALAREVGHVPVRNEITLKARTDPGFPWHTTLVHRYGGKAGLVVKLHEFCKAHGHEDVAASCTEYLSRSAEEPGAPAPDVQPELGYVYLMRSGRYYKIGRSNAVGRRERELAIQLPEEAKVVHSIKTDDPVGIEAYWHNRFSARRRNGEWFELQADEIAAFKRRKFM